MPINFPTSLDSLSNPSASDVLDGALLHSVQHANANDILEALEAKLGIGASTPAQGKLLKGTGAGSSAWLALGTARQMLRVNAAGTDLEFFTVPAVRVYHNAAQSISNTTFTTLAFNSEATTGFDTEAMHDLVTNNSRITIVTPGVYLVGASVDFAANATGVRLVVLHRFASGGGGDTAIASVDGVTIGTVDDHSMSLVTAYAMAAGDYFTLQVWQNSGGALNVPASSAYSPEFWAVWVSP